MADGTYSGRHEEGPGFLTKARSWTWRLPDEFLDNLNEERPKLFLQGKRIYPKQASGGILSPSKEPPRASFDTARKRSPGMLPEGDLRSAGRRLRKLRMLAPADRNADNRSLKPNALALAVPEPDLDTLTLRLYNPGVEGPS